MARVYLLVAYVSDLFQNSITAGAQIDSDSGTATGMRLIDPWDPPASDLQQLGKHDRKPWASARDRLGENARAILLAADPDVWLVPDFLDPQDADELVAALRERSREHNGQTTWCFHPDTYKLRERFRDVSLFRNEEGEDCTEDQELGRRVAAKMERSVSFAWMIAPGESSLADNVSRLIESESGLLAGHAHHMQIIEYGGNQSLPAHADCNHDTNDNSATALLYLSDVDAGGHTCFTRRGFCVMPRQGAALFYSSVDADGQCDMLSEHATRKVTSGSKVVLLRLYSSSYVVPAAESDRAFCDEGYHCRHVVFNRSRRRAAELTRKGNQLAEGGKVSKAKIKFQDALKVYPAYAPALLGLGELFYDEGLFKKAQRVLRDALRESPIWPEVHYLLGQICMDKGRYAEAAEHFETVVDVSPDDVSGWFLLASALAEISGRKQDALRALEQHFAVSPDDDSAKELQLRLEESGSEL